MSLGDSVRDLCELATELNELTSRLNSNLSTIEAALRTGGVGVEFWLHTLILKPNAEHGGFVVGWAKLGGKWRLAWAGASEEDGAVVTYEEHESGALLEAPRAMRVAAAAHVEALIDGLRAAITSELSAFEAVKPTLAELPSEVQSTADEDIPF